MPALSICGADVAVRKISVSKIVSKAPLRVIPLSTMTDGTVCPTLIDELRPDSLSRLTFHPVLDRQLRRLAVQSRDALPNLLFYGPPGAGKRTRVICLMRRLLQPRTLTGADASSSPFERYTEHRTLYVNTTTRSATFAKVTRARKRGRPPKSNGAPTKAKRKADDNDSDSDDEEDAAPSDISDSADRRAYNGAKSNGAISVAASLAKAVGSSGANKPSAASYNVHLSCVVSPYHIEFTPADAGRKDAQVIQACVKLFCEQARSAASLRSVFATTAVADALAEMDSAGNGAKNDDINGTPSAADSAIVGAATSTLPYRVVIVNSADKLSYDAHAAMRRVMEENVDVLRFILLAEQVTKIAPAIRSRCFQIRVPAPPESAITKALQHAVELRQCGGRFGGNRAVFWEFVDGVDDEHRQRFFNDSGDRRILPRPTLFLLLELAQRNMAYALTLLVFNDVPSQPSTNNTSSTSAVSGGRGRGRRRKIEPTLPPQQRLVERDELRRPGWAQETRAMAKAFVFGYGYVMEARADVEKAWGEDNIGPLNYAGSLLAWARRVAFEFLSRCVPMRDFIWTLLDQLLWWIEDLRKYATTRFSAVSAAGQLQETCRARAIERAPERWTTERCDVLCVRCVHLCAAFEQRIVTAYRPIVQLDALFVHLVETCEYHRAGAALPDAGRSLPQLN